MISDQQIQDLVSKIKEAIPALKILLFGSYARGEANEESDLNLCIIVASDADIIDSSWPSAQWIYRACALKQAVGPGYVCLDPHLFTEEEFEKLKGREHPFLMQIVEEGRVLYER